MEPATQQHQGLGARLLSSLVLVLLSTLLITPAHAFTNPVKPLNGSDPQMVYYEGMYYLTSTSWSNVQLTVAPTIEGLKSAVPVTLYEDKSDPRRARNWWAPEMHFVEGRWYMYFSTSINGTWPEMLPSLTTWVLQGPATAPLDGEWSLLGTIRPDNYQGGMLDGTVYAIDGQNYFIFSSVNGTESPKGASLWISELLSPTTVGPATMIAWPEYDWEKNGSAVLEGPQGIKSPVTGEVYVVYSANDCNTPDYKLGSLKLARRSCGDSRARRSDTTTTAKEFADPLLASSWSKLAEPLLQTEASLGVYGPGHNGFFKSPDGTQDWMAYHANENATGRCNDYRQTFIQQVFWDTSDGSPRLSPPIAAGVWIDEPSGTKV